MIVKINDYEDEVVMMIIVYSLILIQLSSFFFSFGQGVRGICGSPMVQAPTQSVK
mgnify:CR=1 FL=1